MGERLRVSAARRHKAGAHISAAVRVIIGAHVNEAFTCAKHTAKCFSMCCC